MELKVITDLEPQNVARNLIENGNQKQPFYIFDMDEAYRRIQHFKQMMPRVKIFYAMKANDTPMMLRLAISQGLGFDCASPNEMYKLRRLNVTSRNMIYTTPIKQPAHIKYANETGLRYTVFDSSNELKNLKKYWRDARLLLRIRIKTEDEAISLTFGCDYQTEAVELLEQAADFGLKVAGIAFHGDGSGESYVKGLKYAKALFEHEAKFGRIMKIVNIGGGFDSERTDSIDKVSKLINRALNDFFPDADVKIIGTPGKYICASSFTLYCAISNVIRVKRNDKSVTMIYVTDGIYGTLRYFRDPHNIRKFKKASETIEPCEFEDIIIWGPSCDSRDYFLMSSEVHLEPCTPQDWLVFSNNGAYSLSFATKFSSISIPLVQPVVSSHLWNKINNSDGFTEGEVEIQNDAPSLSSTLPNILPRRSICQHPNIPILKT